MTEAKITSISMTGYWEKNPSISVTVQTQDGISYFSLKGEEVTQMLSLAWQLIEKKKFAMAEAIMQIKTPVALMAPESKLVEGDSDGEF